MENKYDQFKGQPHLPKFVVPTRYSLRLKPDLVTCKFTGYVDISVDVVSDTKFIVLNAAELSIDPKSVHFKSSTVHVKSSNKVFEAWEVGLIEEDEIVVVEFGKSLPLGVGVLSMAFEGALNDRMKGFYKKIAHAFAIRFPFIESRIILFMLFEDPIVPTNIMGRKGTWLLSNLNQLIPGVAFRAGMNMLVRYCQHMAIFATVRYIFIIR
ncbi:aminopeptidase M1-like [Lycium barbarum]|uniref:aminopeptidase M1-like n=1 Tax=Lycium barbarum TaxID=112863 RepID=UPI00293F5548|nr:aminopeptidase M1-like [Lycium barbarum]